MLATHIVLDVQAQPKHTLDPFVFNFGYRQNNHIRSMLKIQILVSYPKIKCAFSRSELK